MAVFGGAPTTRKTVDDIQAPARLGLWGGTDRARDRSLRQRMRSIPYHDPKACSRPVGSDAYLLIPLQARMADAVPNELRHDQLRIVEQFRRDRERLQRTAHPG